MKRRKFLQNKLWRDKIVEKVKNEGGVLHVQKLTDDEEFSDELKQKLCEEALEVAHTQSKDELIDELGDVYEVLDALINLHGLDKKLVQERRASKRAERGDYSGRQYVTVSEYPDGSRGAQYCLDDPTIYPEILD